MNLSINVNTVFNQVYLFYCVNIHTKVKNSFGTIKVNIQLLESPTFSYSGKVKETVFLLTVMTEF